MSVEIRDHFGSLLLNLGLLLGVVGACVGQLILLDLWF